MGVLEYSRPGGLEALSWSDCMIAGIGGSGGLQGRSNTLDAQRGRRILYNESSNMLLT